MAERTFTEAPASWNTRYQTEDGYICQITLRAETGKELLEKAEAALDWLKKHNCQPVGVTTARASGNASGANGEAPKCPTHGTPMKRSRFGGWYCPVKIADDDGTGKPVYCKQKVNGEGE